MVAAIYCRLSKEDEDKHTESESIQNQKSLLVQYAKERGWAVHGFYCDEDYSGIDSERPAFRQLIREAEQKIFDIVLVKTQSRFTRDMELVERYIHGKFAEWGVRFVAMVDNVDTDVRGNKKARQINGLINEWYLEDLSENIRAVFEYKRKKGLFIGAFPVYGYQKAPGEKNKLIIDHVAAEVVRRIYNLYLSGYGKQHIAGILNAEGVPNPTKYKQSLGWSYANGAQANEFGLWNRTSVGRILRERMYTGDMVQGRRKKVSYKSKKIAPVPKSEWVVVHKTHEAIIDSATFAAVERLLSERTKSTGFGTVHLLAGKVKCMECGNTMMKISNSYKGKRRSYLRCKLYAADKKLCSNHAVRLEALEDQVLTLLKRHIERYYDRCGAEKRLISNEYFNKKKPDVKMETDKLSLEIRSLLDLKELPRELVANFVDTIEIGERNPQTGCQAIRISWLF